MKPAGNIGGKAGKKVLGVLCNYTNAEDVEEQYE